MSQRILRGFGAYHVFDAADASRSKSLLRHEKIDVFICDAELEGHSGFDLVHGLRMDKSHPLRGIPMLISTGTTRMSDIRRARNAGANIVIKKPMSPIALYERLSWISHNPRKFWESESYFGPDRRVRDTGEFKGGERREGAVTEAQIDEEFEVNQSDAA